MDSLGGLGERKIIRMIRRLYPYGWPDDDSYYFDVGRKRLLLTTDSIIEKVHFPRRSDPYLVGRFFAAVNLSDIAAMGGRPVYFMSSLMLPGSMRFGYLEKFERGMHSCLSKHGVKMTGGDIKQSKEIAMTGIVIGSSERRLLKRSGSRRGDLLCVTGSLGKNAAGYYMWKRTGSADGIRLLLDVEPQVKAGIFISKIGASSAIDLSDGVYSAVKSLKEASGNGFEIDYSRLPLDKNAVAVNKRYGVAIEELALNFGGDYQLLFTIPKSAYLKALPLIRKNALKISVIGRVAGGKNVLIKNGRTRPISRSGYEHFR
jgi:thiamine-monophosphate kinase